MEWIVTILYIVGTLITHYVIYKVSGDEVEHPTANIVCLLWPIAWALIAITSLEKFISKTVDSYDYY